MRAINRRGKNKGPQLTVQTEKTRLVRYLLYLYCVMGSGMILFARKGFKFLKQVESKTSHYEIIFKSLARFSMQFRVKEGQSWAGYNILVIQGQSLTSLRVVYNIIH